MAEDSHQGVSARNMCDYEPHNMTHKPGFSGEARLVIEAFTLVLPGCVAAIYDDI